MRARRPGIIIDSRSTVDYCGMYTAVRTVTKTLSRALARHTMALPLSFLPPFYLWTGGVCPRRPLGGHMRPVCRSMTLFFDRGRRSSGSADRANSTFRPRWRGVNQRTLCNPPAQWEKNFYEVDSLAVVIKPYVSERQDTQTPRADAGSLPRIKRNKTSRHRSVEPTDVRRGDVPRSIVRRCGGAHNDQRSR